MIALLFALRMREPRFPIQDPTEATLEWYGRLAWA